MASSVYGKYQLVVGLEVHIQLATNTKAFCNDAVKFGDPENTHTSIVSLAHPGTLPRLNKKQVNYATRLGLALGSKINQENFFDRKNYFYADLPKGYQITQDRQPICIGGKLQIAPNRTIRLHHIHMEEDAGKSNHELDKNNSLIDLNRAGTPLLEIVTEPDFRTPEEVEIFMYAMRKLVRYLGVSDGNMDEGSMRCDCNVSVMLKGSDEFGERCEVKNVNSMKYAKQAISYEFKRQVKILEAGGVVMRNTLNFNPETGITTPLRSKEDAHDYRYFPELDQQPILITNQYLKAVKENLPILPWDYKEIMVTKYQLSEYDAAILTEELATATYFETLANQGFKNYKAIANLMINKQLPYLKDEQMEILDFPVPPASLIQFLKLIEGNAVSNSVAYQKLLPALIEKPTENPESLAKQLNLIQNSDADFLTEIVNEVISANPDKVKAYQKGKKGLIGFFMGEVMKKSKGKANPKETQKLLAAALSD